MGEIRDRNQKVVFGIADTLTPGVRCVILGVPKGAWGYMKEGRTHTFDLTRVGLPVQIVMFGAATHEECLGMLGGRVASSSVDRREEDFEVLPPRDAILSAIAGAQGDEAKADAIVALFRGA